MRFLKIGSLQVSEICNQGPFWVLFSYSNATTTQLIFKNVIYDITLKNKKNQASPSCLNFEKTTQKWPKMAIFAHFGCFSCNIPCLLQQLLILC